MKTGLRAANPVTALAVFSLEIMRLLARVFLLLSSSNTCYGEVTRALNENIHRCYVIIIPNKNSLQEQEKDFFFV
jgi:hypothetical protein